jgi:hypothetical protein
MPRYSHRSKLRFKEDTVREQKKGTKINTSTHQGGRQSHAQFRADSKAFGGIPPPNTTLIMMKIITWNIRGLNGRSKQRILRDCIKAENPDILMLQETKCVGAEVETIFQHIWRGCDFVLTYSTRASGGLAILWNPCHITLSRPFSTIGIVTTHFEVTGSTQEGSITNVYGPQSQ